MCITLVLHLPCGTIVQYRGVFSTPTYCLLPRQVCSSAARSSAYSSAGCWWLTRGPPQPEDVRTRGDGGGSARAPHRGYVKSGGARLSMLRLAPLPVLPLTSYPRTPAAAGAARSFALPLSCWYR